MSIAISAATRKEYEEVLRVSAELSPAPREDISPPARKELEAVLLMLVSDIRAYRDNAQKHLNDPTIAYSDMLLTVGKVKASRDILGVIDMLAELYKVSL